MAKEEQNLKEIVQLREENKLLRRKYEEIYKKFSNFRYNHRQEMELLNATKQADLLGSGVLEVVKSMIEASLSNPLMGVVSSLIISDILYNAKVIDLPTTIGITVAAGVVEGSQVATEIGNIVSDFTNITHIFGSQAQQTDPIKPSATTIVLGNKKEDLQALMNRENQP